MFLRVSAAIAVTAALAATGAAADAVPWRKAVVADAIAKPSAVWETWELRAIDPRGRRGITLRFWAKRNAIGVVWLLYERGKKPAYDSDGFEALSDGKPGIRMKARSGAVSLSLRGRRWHLRVTDPAASRRANLVVAGHLPGPTIGPLRVHGRPGWLSVLAVGRAQGEISFARRRWRVRGWRTVVLHEWAEWQPFGGGGSWVRRDLGVLFRKSRIDLVWGIDEYEPGSHAWNPKEDLWEGVIARIDRPLSVCPARSKHGPVFPGGMVTPTRGLRATCHGRSLALRWIRDAEMGIAPGGLHYEVTGLATSDAGGAGFLDQSLADP